MEPFSLRLTAQLKDLEEIRRFIEQSAASLQADLEATQDLVLAADEAATNVILHGYRREPGVIEIEVGREADNLVVTLRDQAPPFDPAKVPAPDITIPLEERFFGGMGIHLMRASTDQIHYRPIPQGGNELTLVKRAFGVASP